MVENDEYAAFLRRVLRAYARRVADGDVEALTLMLGLSAEIDNAIAQAVTGLRGFGYSWAEIGSRLGITRQAAQQRWGKPLDRRDSRPRPRTHPGPGPGATADDTPVSRADFRAWERQLAAGTVLPPDPAPLPHRHDRPGHRRTRPRLRPGVSAACGNRREAVCPACSAIYKRDARQLVRAGLAGGKGIPDTITAHPCVFATLTAPSFGPVHARRMRGKTVLPCRPRRDAKARRCPHGRDISCPTRHVETDPRLGQPMCPDCYDYQAAVLFNAYAADLWRRFTTYLPRQLARRLGITQKDLRAAGSASGSSKSPNTRHAASSTSTPSSAWTPPARTTSPRPPGSPLTCCATPSAWPPLPPPPVIEHQDRPSGSASARRPTSGPSATATTCPAPARHSNGQAVANYIAKYATKTLAAPGLPCHAGSAAMPTSSGCAARRTTGGMITTAWQLGTR